MVPIEDHPDETVDSIVFDEYQHQINNMVLAVNADITETSGVDISQLEKSLSSKMDPKH